MLELKRTILTNLNVDGFCPLLINLYIYFKRCYIPKILASRIKDSTINDALKKIPTLNNSDL